MKIFISYAEQDSKHIDELLKRVEVIGQSYSFDCWHRGMARAGEDWQRRADNHLEEADLIILAVSPDFFVTQRCYQIELARALARHEEGTVRVLPVILRPLEWEAAPFSQLSVLPKQGRAVTTWRNIDEAWLDVERGLRTVVAEKHKSLAERSLHLQQENRDLRRREAELQSRCVQLEQELQQATSGSALRQAQQTISDLTGQLGAQHRELQSREEMITRLQNQRQELQAQVAQRREELNTSKHTIDSLTAKLMVRAEIMSGGPIIYPDDEFTLFWLLSIKNVGDGDIRLLTSATNWRIVSQQAGVQPGAEILGAPELLVFDGNPIIQPGSRSELYQVKVDTRILGKQGAKTWRDTLRPVVRVHFEGVRVNLKTSAVRMLPDDREFVLSSGDGDGEGEDA